MTHFTGLNIQVVADYGATLMDIEKDFKSNYAQKDNLNIKEFRQLVKNILKVGIEQDFKQELLCNKAMIKLAEDTRLRLIKESSEDEVDEPLNGFESLASYLFDIATEIGEICTNATNFGMTFGDNTKAENNRNNNRDRNRDKEKDNQVNQTGTRKRERSRSNSRDNKRTKQDKASSRITDKGN
jgi:hypothetical protein